jgi:hypothetical protein
MAILQHFWEVSTWLTYLHMQLECSSGINFIWTPFVVKFNDLFYTFFTVSGFSIQEEIILCPHLRGEGYRNALVCLAVLLSGCPSCRQNCKISGICIHSICVLGYGHISSCVVLSRNVYAKIVFINQSDREVVVADIFMVLKWLRVIAPWCQLS